MAEVTAVSNNVPVTVEAKVQPKVDTDDDLTNEDESVFTMEEALEIAESQKPKEVKKENKYSFADGAIDDVKDFVKKANELDYDVDLSLGKYTVDAKSIMGIFSIDLSKELKLVAHTDDTAELEKAIAKFIK